MRRKTHLTSKYRSKLEERVAALVPDAKYESVKLKYTKPASNHYYLTDLELGPNNFLEIKGRLLPTERTKYLLVREQNPEITLRFFFDKSDNKLYKGSKTTYSDWCNKHGFEWTDTKLGFPKAWLKPKRT